MYFAKRIFLFIAMILPFGLFSQERPEQRMTGLFKKGMPADTIKEYYDSGALKSLYYPYKKTYKYEGRKYNYCLYLGYEENGICVRHTDDRIGYEQKFDPNGDLISYMIYNRKKSKVNYYIEFYPQSTKKMVITRGNRYDYDSMERLRRHWVRKKLRSDNKFGDNVSVFYFEEYNVLGDVTKSGRFYTSLYEQDPWVQLAPEFPTDLDSVPMQDFKEIAYPQWNLKEVYKWDYSKNRTIITRYEQQGDSWTKIRRRTFPRKSTNYLSYSKK